MTPRSATLTTSSPGGTAAPPVRERSRTVRTAQPGPRDARLDRQDSPPRPNGRARWSPPPPRPATPTSAARRTRHDQADPDDGAASDAWPPAVRSRVPPRGSAGCGVRGLWRSLVAHLTGGQGVAGSNPVSPTIGFSTIITLSAALHPAADSPSMTLRSATSAQIGPTTANMPPRRPASPGRPGADTGWSPPGPGGRPPAATDVTRRPRQPSTSARYAVAHAGRAR